MVVDVPERVRVVPDGMSNVQDVTLTCNVSRTCNRIEQQWKSLKRISRNQVRGRKRDKVRTDEESINVADVEEGVKDV